MTPSRPRRSSSRAHAGVDVAPPPSNEYIQIALEHSRDLTCVIDREARFLYANPSFERVLGYAPPSLIGTPAANLLHPDDREPARAAVERLLETATADEVELRCRRRDGAWVLLAVVAQWVPATGGTRACAVVTGRDVTDRKQLEEELFAVQKMEAIRRLAGGIAHDFNNLLTAIIGHCDLVAKALGGEDPLRVHLDQIRAATDRAASLTRQLVAFSRKQILTFHELDLNAVLKELEPRFRRSLGEQIELTVAPAEEPTRVRANPDQIEQVLKHLVLNARDAMPEGGTLRIETANVNVDAKTARRHVGVQPGSYVTLIVQDTGRGLDARTRRAIFEPYFTTKPFGQGSGLGLSVVYGILKQCGGTIVAEGEPGKGATFTIYLPRVTEKAGIQADRTRTDGSPTVLLAEDEELVRRVVQTELESLGFAVLAARDGTEALRLCDGYGGPIDLLVTDVVMPDLTGPELAARVHALRPETRVLYFSAYADDALIAQGLLDRSASFLSKPFTLDRLIAKVRETLGRPRNGSPETVA